MITSKEIIENLAQEIIDRLENFNGEWYCPFSSALPINIQTKKPYRGVNVLILDSSKKKNSFNSNMWGTFKQWTDKGFKIKKGAKSQQVILWKPSLYKVEDENSATNEVVEIERVTFLLKTFLVFNGSQIEGFTQEKEEDFTFKPELKSFFDNIGIVYNLTDEAGAYYVPSRDCVNIPHYKYFNTEEGFYGVLSHEFVHATGHKNRLNRDFKGKFGSESYAFEELVAEIGAGFICSYLGISNQLSDNNIAYIKSWIKVIKENKRSILTACSYAQKAFDYLLNFGENE